jgi:type IV pilus assembly protein PilO
MDPARRQKLLLGAAALAAAGYGFYTYVYGPRAEEVTLLETHLSSLQAQNTTARALAAGASGDVERRLGAYRDQLHAVEGLIPSSEELPDLLDAISTEAQRTGVEISLIQPVGATEEQYYTKRVYDMAVIGTYHQVGAFLTRVASLPRIVTPMNLVVAPKDAPTGPGQPAPGADLDKTRLEARFSVETYVIPAATPAPAGNAD